MRPFPARLDPALLPLTFQLRPEEERGRCADAALKLRLYVAGDAPNSARARSNLYAMCKSHVRETYDIEIVDVFESPEMAAADRIRMTPTLLKVNPAPVRRIVGALNEPRRTLLALGLNDFLI